MADPTRVNINLAEGVIEVGGVNIADAVSAVHIRATKHSGTTLTLGLADIEHLEMDIGQDGQARARVDDRVHRAMVALGWTPPPNFGTVDAAAKALFEYHYRPNGPDGDVREFDWDEETYYSKDAWRNKAVAVLRAAGMQIPPARDGQGWMLPGGPDTVDAKGRPIRRETSDG